MTANQIADLLRRALFLDGGAYREFRDDQHLTIVAFAALGVAVLLAALGAFFYGKWVVNGYDFAFMDTIVLGSLFMVLLFLADIGIVYLVLIQVFRIDIAPDALARLIAIGHLPYALGLFVFIQEIGFAFGIASVLGVFYWTLFALRTALPAADEKRLSLAVLAGMLVWIIVIPLISETPGNEFVTGVFVYGTIA